MTTITWWQSLTTGADRPSITMRMMAGETLLWSFCWPYIFQSGRNKQGEYNSMIFWTAGSIPSARMEAMTSCGGAGKGHILKKVHPNAYQMDICVKCAQNSGCNTKTWRCKHIHHYLCGIIEIIMMWQLILWQWSWLLQNHIVHQSHIRVLLHNMMLYMVQPIIQQRKNDIWR